MSKKRSPKEGALADERWEGEGGRLDGDANGDAAAEKATPAEERAKRWKAATAEHWHAGGSSEETKRRAEER
jgi:hypothetical protein